MREIWAAKLRARLGTEVIAPTLPNPDNPRYDTWSTAICDQINAMQSRGIVVAHSVAGSITLKLFSLFEVNIPPAEIHILAAPFWCGADPDWEVEDFRLPPKPLNWIRNHTRLVFYHGDADEVVSVAHLDEYAGRFPNAQTLRLAGVDHMFTDTSFRWIKHGVPDID